MWNGELDIASRVGILVHEWKFKTVDKASELTGALGNDNGRNQRSTYDPDICPYAFAQAKLFLLINHYSYSSYLAYDEGPHLHVGFPIPKPISASRPLG